jgi:hypothetical protein
MFEMMLLIGEHQEMLWMALAAGIAGVLLHSVLYKDVVRGGKSLLDFKFVRDVRDRSRRFESCCRCYERQADKVWMRVVGLTMSCLLIGFSVACLLAM